MEVASASMAGPVEQVGVIVACPVCQKQVLQKTMIPMSVLDKVITYNCVDCARKHLRTASPLPSDASPETEPAA